MPSSPLLDVPFDQYSRQFQVAALLNDLRAKDERFNILDVGGYKGKTTEFFSDDSVTVLDVFEDVDEPNYVQGDGLALPFKDRSFDFVLNFDVLEHIPRSKRHRFMDECARVAKRGVVISAPQRTEANQDAEESLNKLYRSLHGEDHRWLGEHIAYVLPDFADAEKYLQKKGFHTLQLPSNDTMLWVLMQGAIFLNSKFPMGAPEVIALNKYYNKHFKYDGGVDRHNTYRLIMCAVTAADDHAKLERHFAEKNRPLDLRQRLELVERLHNFQKVLLSKLTEHAENLQTMHEHEAQRAAELQTNGEALWKRIQELEAENRRLSIEAAKGVRQRLRDKVKRRLSLKK